MAVPTITLNQGSAGDVLTLAAGAFGFLASSTSSETSMEWWDTAAQAGAVGFGVWGEFFPLARIPAFLGSAGGAYTSSQLLGDYTDKISAEAKKGELPLSDMLQVAGEGITCLGDLCGAADALATICPILHYALLAPSYSLIVAGTAISAGQVGPDWLAKLEHTATTATSGVLTILDEYESKAAGVLGDGWSPVSVALKKVISAVDSLVENLSPANTAAFVAAANTAVNSTAATNNALFQMFSSSDSGAPNITETDTNGITTITTSDDSVSATSSINVDAADDTVSTGCLINGSDPFTISGSGALLPDGTTTLSTQAESGEVVGSQDLTSDGATVTSQQLEFDGTPIVVPPADPTGIEVTASNSVLLDVPAFDPADDLTVQSGSDGSDQILLGGDVEGTRHRSSITAPVRCSATPSRSAIPTAHRP